MVGLLFILKFCQFSQLYSFSIHRMGFLVIHKFKLIIRFKEKYHPMYTVKHREEQIALAKEQAKIFADEAISGLLKCSLNVDDHDDLFDIRKCTF